MPRPRKNASQSPGSTASTSSTGSAGAENKVTGGQAAYVLDRLIGERRITRTDVNRYVAEMGREITELERKLNALREAHGGTIAAVAAATVAAGAAVVAVARRRGRPPGRPAGSGRKPGRPPASAAASTAGTGAAAAPARRGPGRPPGSGRKPGRPAGSGASASTAAATGSDSGAKRGRKPTTAITAGQLASRQLQGRYLALVRQFPENKRAQYARTAKEKGRETAIKEMQDSLKK
jgi:hypothetical protein